MYDPTHKKEEIYRGLEDDDKLDHLPWDLLSKQKDGLEAVVSAWNQSQKALVPIIGENLPLLFHKSAGILALYVIDTRELEGYFGDVLADAAKPIVVAKILQDSQVYLLPLL